MSTKVRLVVAVVTVLGLVVLPIAAAPAQQQAGVDIKQEIKTPVSAGEGDGALSAVTSLSAAAAAAAKTGTNVQVSQDQDPAAVFRSGASELTVAATSGGSRSVAGWNDGEGFGFAPFTPDAPPLGLSGYGFSADGGRTWTDGGAPPIGSKVAFGPGTVGRSATGNYVTRGDPWLDVDSMDTFFYANLAVWEDDPDLPPAGISVHKGTFRNKTFSWNDSVLVQSPNYPNDFLDKEAMAVDRRQGRTAVYVTTTNFEEVCDIPFFGFGTIELYRSLNGGANWSRTVIQPDETSITDPTDPDCGADGVVNQGSAPAVGPGGELYVAWERGWFAPASGGAELPRATIAFSSSTNRGQTFSTPVEVASICSMAVDPPAAYNRTSSNDFPRIAVSQSGRIFVTYHDCSAADGDAPFGADTDVYVTYSDDKGATWSAPAAVHAVADGKAQFWPVVSAGARGQVDVTYYQMEDVNLTPEADDIECSVRVGGTLDEPVLRESTVTTLSDVYRARSSDGGATWGMPVRVTDATTNWCAATPLNSIIPNFGDYNTSVTVGRDVFATWADGRNAGIADRVPTAFFARSR
jgi:hypothetical protein